MRLPSKDFGSLESLDHSRQPGVHPATHWVGWRNEVFLLQVASQPIVIRIESGEILPNSSGHQIRDRPIAALGNSNRYLIGIRTPGWLAAAGQSQTAGLAGLGCWLQMYLSLRYRHWLNPHSLRMKRFHSVVHSPSVW